MRTFNAIGSSFSYSHKNIVKLAQCFKVKNFPLNARPECLIFGRKMVSSWRQNCGSKPTFCFHWTSGPVPEAVTHNYSSVSLWVWNESEWSLYASPQIGLEMCALDSDGAFSRGRPNTTGGQAGKLLRSSQRCFGHFRQSSSQLRVKGRGVW